MDSDSVMNDIRQLSNTIYWDRVEAARSESFEEKFLGGAQLFDYGCRIVCDGIRMQNPGISDEEVERVFSERLELQQRLERLR